MEAWRRSDPGANCATLRGESAMYTLFGHIKGAFTGAVTHLPEATDELA